MLRNLLKKFHKVLSQKNIIALICYPVGRIMSYGQLYKKFSAYYDKIYENVDYVGESEFIKQAVKKYKTSPGIELMDVACGTGSHAMILKNNFKVTGVDINENILEIARRKVPEADFIKGNMKKLELKSKSTLLSVLILCYTLQHKLQRT